MKDILDRLQKLVNPEQAASWQTFIMLSLLSWLVSYLVVTPVEALLAQLFPEQAEQLQLVYFDGIPVQDIISNLGWIFLIIGVWWFTYTDDKKLNIKKTLTFENFFIGPWITGALICVYLFGEWEQRPLSLPFVMWPLISVTIAVIPKFIAVGPKFQIPKGAGDRQEIIILVLSNLVLSCWFQLYFSVQNLLLDYPSLLSDNFERSAFVIKLDSQNQRTARGVTMLNLSEALVETDLEGRPWSEVERWLFELDQQIVRVDQAVREQLSPISENRLWSLGGQVRSGQGYVLDLIAQWFGPSSGPSGYYLTKSCQITQIQQQRSTTRVAPTQSSLPPVGRVECGTIQGPFLNSPESAPPDAQP